MRATLPRPTGSRFPRDIVAYAVRAHHRVALTTADIEDVLAERGVIVSRAAIRLRVDRLGPPSAACIARDRSKPADRRRLVERDRCDRSASG